MALPLDAIKEAIRANLEDRGILGKLRNDLRLAVYSSVKGVDLPTAAKIQHNHPYNPVNEGGVSSSSLSSSSSTSGETVSSTNPVPTVQANILQEQAVHYQQRRQLIKTDESVRLSVVLFIEFLDSLGLLSTKNILLSELGLATEEMDNLILNNPYTIQSLSNRYQIDYTSSSSSSSVYHGGLVATLLSHLHSQGWNTNKGNNTDDNNRVTVENSNGSNKRSLATLPSSPSPLPLTRTISNGSANQNNEVASIASTSSSSSSFPLSPSNGTSTTNNNIRATASGNHRNSSNNKSLVTLSPYHSSNNTNNNLSGYTSDSFDEEDEEHFELSNVSNNSTNNIINNGGLLSSPFTATAHPTHNTTNNSGTSLFSPSKSNVPLSPTNSIGNNHHPHHVTSSIVGPGGRISPSRDILPTTHHTATTSSLSLSSSSAPHNPLGNDNLLTNSVILSPITNNYHHSSPPSTSTSNHNNHSSPISPGNAHVAEMQARYGVFTTVPGIHASPSSPSHVHQPSGSTYNGGAQEANTNSVSSSLSSSSAAASTFNGTKSISKALGLSNDIGKLVLELEKQENSTQHATNPSNINHHNPSISVQLLSSPTVDHSPLPSTESVATTSFEDTSMPSLASNLHTPPPPPGVNSTSSTNSNSHNNSSLFHPSVLAEHGYGTIDNLTTTKTVTKRATITPFVNAPPKEGMVYTTRNGNDDEQDEEEEDEFTNQQLRDSDERTDNDRMNTVASFNTRDNQFGKTIKNNKKKYQLSSLNETDTSDHSRNDNIGDADENEEEEEDGYSPSAMRRSIKSAASRFSESQRSSNEDDNNNGNDYFPDDEAENSADAEAEERSPTKNGSGGIDFSSTLRVPLSKVPQQERKTVTTNNVVPASPPDVPSPSITTNRIIQAQSSPGNQSNASEGDYYGSEFDDSNHSNDTSNDTSKQNISSPGGYVPSIGTPVKTNMFTTTNETKKSLLGELPPFGEGTNRSHGTDGGKLSSSIPAHPSTVPSSLLGPPTVSSPAEEIEEEELPNYDDEFDGSPSNRSLLNSTANTTHNRSRNLGDSEQDLSYRHQISHDEQNNDDGDDDEVDLSRSPY